MNLRHSIANVLCWEDASAHFLHRVERLLRFIDAFSRVGQADDEVVGSRCATVRLENVLQALLCANVLLRRNAEISDGDGCGEIKPR